MLTSIGSHSVFLVWVVSIMFGWWGSSARLRDVSLFKKTNGAGKIFFPLRFLLLSYLLYTQSWITFFWVVLVIEILYPLICNFFLKNDYKWAFNWRGYCVNSLSGSLALFTWYGLMHYFNIE